MDSIKFKIVNDLQKYSSTSKDINETLNFILTRKK